MVVVVVDVKHDVAAIKKEMRPFQDDDNASTVGLINRWLTQCSCREEVVETFWEQRWFTQRTTRVSFGGQINTRI